MGHQREPKDTYVSIANWSSTVVQRQFSGESILYSSDGAGIGGHLSSKNKKKGDLNLVLYVNISSKYITDLNVWYKTL